MPPAQKRLALLLYFPGPAPKLEIEESSATGAARQPGPTSEADTWDEIVEAMMDIAPTTLEGVDQRVTELDTTVRQRTEEFQVAIPRRHIEYEPGTCITEHDASRSRRIAKQPWCTGTSRRNQVPTSVKCLTTDFLKCQPMNFKGTQGVVSLTQWVEKMESVFLISNCTNQQFRLKAVGQDVAYAIPWMTLTRMITDKYCPRGEIKKLESEYWNLKVRGTDLLTYNQRFQELALMCDRMFPKESAKVQRYVSGLPDMIHCSVKASKPQSMQEAIEFATEMMDKKMLTVTECKAENKRKFKDTSRNNQNQQQPFKRNNVAQTYTAGPRDKKPYGGTKPLCTRCNYHHDGPCAQKYTNCKKIGHSVRDYKGRPAATNNNNNNSNNQRAQGANPKGITCFECGVQAHFRSDCPKLKNGNQGNRAGNGNAIARAYVVGFAGINPNSNVVTGTFLLSNLYASILFDIGANRIFISTAFSSLIDIIPTTLDHEMGSFDVIIGMDWLAKYHIVIVCDENLVRVPFGDEILIFHGEETDNSHESASKITTSCTKTQKYLLKGCPIFLAHFFPSTFHGIPPTRQVEFQIDLRPGVAPVARAPYRLAPFEMNELSDELKELSDKGLYDPFPTLALRLLPEDSLKDSSTDPPRSNDQAYSKEVITIVKFPLSPRGNRKVPVADALSRKEREPLRVRALVMTIGLDLPKQIFGARTEARKPENLKSEDVGGFIPSPLERAYFWQTGEVETRVLLDEIHIDDKLRFVEEPMEIMDREVKRLKQSRIPIIKVLWNSRRGPEFTWERKDQFRKKYP
ncbi:putative reverse transcriptase domain-containing protein [Tanacetum coccineum]|uniref:Reverse transcriptase domain-containing protein n=1 Tax=Tanacetum coccineum TaxID=301880 RepID=A0ABQ5HEP9_9ASTR